MFSGLSAKMLKLTQKCSVSSKSRNSKKILAWFCFKSRQDQNKKLEIDFKIRNCYQDFLTISQEIS